MADGFSRHDEDTLSPEQRASVFEAAPDPVQLLNAQGEILRANLAAQRALGLTLDRLVGRPVSDFVAQEHHDALLDCIEAAAMGRANTLEVRTHAQRDDDIWWEVHVFPLDLIRLGPVVMICRDITAARRRDAGLRGQAQILRAIAEAAPLHDILDACCRLAEQALEGGRCCVLLRDANGLPSQPAAPEEGSLALPPLLVSSLHDVRVGDHDASAAPGMARFRLIVARQDNIAPVQAGAAGERRRHAMTACWSLPLRVHGSSVGAFAAYVRASQPPSDTELAQVWHCANLASLALGQLAARQALSESENRFRIAAEVLPGFLWVADPSGNMTYVNRYYREYTGRSAPELIDGAWLETIHPDDRDECRAIWETAIAQGTDAEGRYRIRMQDGVYRWFLERGMPQRGADGKITAWVGIAVDIEELIASREAIQRYRCELEAQVDARNQALSQTASELHAETTRREQAMEALAHKHKIDALGQLTAGVAHDFNNLLVAIMGGFQLIELRAQDPGIAQLTRNGLHASERAASLVRQLLSVARREKPRPEQINLAEALPAMQDLLRHALASRHLLHIDIAPDIWPVFIDAPQLETALLNLAVNARDAMPEEGSLTITARNLPAGAEADADSVVITVSDTGSGIPAALLARVCDPFFTTKPRGEGTGLGLAMVKNFVTASGGGMVLESPPGQGTRISLRLPRAEAQAAAPLAWPTADPATRRATTILVVEDDEAVRPITCAFLRDAGFRVLEAASGAVALALLQVAGDVDLLLTDLAMPSMDGLQLAQAVRAARPGLPALLVTSHADGQDLSSEIVLRKPFTSHDLIAAVGAALGHPPEPPKRHDRLLNLMRSPVIREAYMTWTALRGAQSLPRFGALTVAGRAWADQAFLLAVDTNEQGPHFRCVSVGRALQPYLPYAPGETIRPSPRMEALLGPLEQIYFGCATDFMPHFQAVEVPTESGRGAPGERLLMPVTSEAGGVTHLLGLICLETP